MSTCVMFVSMRRYASVLAMVLFFVTTAVGCHHHPVRHLASDVGLIKKGETTRKEALSLLGDPDSTRMVAEATEEWTYYEEDKSMLQQAPVVGNAFSSKGYNTVILTIHGDIVVGARYGSYNKHEFDWQDDYTWQKIDKKTETKSDSK